MQDKIINILKKSTEYLSGEEMSRQLKMSRSAIWKHIEESRKDGYDIVAVPHLGYRLLSSPDKLLPREIQFKLNTRFIGQKIFYHEALRSTMENAFRLAMENEPEGTVVCAETQTKGKGRLGRHWSSPKGKGIYMSIILRPKLFPTDVAKLTLLSAVAVAEAVKNVTGIQAKIKWPNDLLIDGKKIAGILTEMSGEMDRVHFVIVGVGLNVNTVQSALPDCATSIKCEWKKTCSRVLLIQEILRSIEHWYDEFCKNGFTKVSEQWQEYSATLGKRIKIEDPSGDIEGQAIGIDENGGLIIRSDSGLTLKKMTGDVVQIS